MAERSIKVGQLAEMTGVSRSYLSETLCRNAVSKSAAIKINSALGEEIFT
jgi:plasmid maintenance system antidote protein VapI